VPLADKLEAIVTVLGRAERSYRPPRSRLPVVLYACDGTDRDRTEHRWRDVVDQLEVVDVPGTHTSERFYLRGERVGQLAEDLRRRLEGLDNSS
jgi:thioesterase domain-containing protein